MTEESIAVPTRNRFDRMEFAGAFGDLGTLVPFVVAYIGVLKMDPFGVLLAFGLAMIACGFVYRTPMPVQPMKAAGAGQQGAADVNAGSVQFALGQQNARNDELHDTPGDHGIF